MPELPEVENFRSMVSNNCVGSKITDVIVLEQGSGPRDGLFDDKVLTGGEELDYKKLIGLNISSVNRKGKQLWMTMTIANIANAKSKGSKKASDTDTDLLFVMFHFGMTGAFVIKDVDSGRTYKSFKVHDNEWPPRFTKIEIIFDNNIRLAFCDPRRFGRVRLSKSDPIDLPEVLSLAKDPFNEDISYDELHAGLMKSSLPIKSLLLDQNKLMCGIGNWVADEILYHAGIHPQIPASTFNHEGITILKDTIRMILQKSIDCNIHKVDFPEDWLFHKRWDKKKDSIIKMPNGMLCTSHKRTITNLITCTHHFYYLNHHY